jgi:beta-lactamase regulating signal transducer with metallopeptidase domain
MMSAVPLLLEASLRALLAAAAVWAGLRLLGVGNVLVQKLAWALVLVAALALPLLPRWRLLPDSVALRLPHLASQPQASAAPERKPQQAVTEPNAETTAYRYDGSRYPSPIITTGQVDSPADTPASPAIAERPSPAAFSPVPAAPKLAAAAPQAQPLRIPFAAMAWFFYMAVFAVLLLRLVLGIASALRLWLTATPIPADAQPDSVQANDGAITHLRSSARVASPVNIGSGIVLPADYTSWDEEKLRIVLAHERSHIRQGDFYLQLAAALYAAVFWFSPLGWWLKRKLYELGEAISDRAGLEQAASRSSYAQILLEFAALPRPTLTGVAMARTSHLSERIERLLNESSFRNAFAAAGRRALLAVLLVPVALLAATTLVRVEAADKNVVEATTQTTQPAAVPGQSSPEQVSDDAAPKPAPRPEPATAPQAASAPASQPQPAAPPAPDADGNPIVMSDENPDLLPDGKPLVLVGPHSLGANGPFIITIPRIDIKPMPAMKIRIPDIDVANLRSAFELDSNPRLYMRDGGDPYALVGDPGTHIRYNGDLDGEHKGEIDKARQMAHGHFLWFRHDDKSYIVDDPAIVAEIEAMDKPMDELGEQMKALGKQMRDLGQQQREAGSQMRAANVPTPDLSKEIADLTAALTTLQAKQGSTINQKELGELQRQMGQVMGQLGALQGKIAMEQSGFGDSMGKFGKQQGEFGSQMGKLGAQMGQLARENREKIDGIIKDSLATGKAKPVQ